MDNQALARFKVERMHVAPRALELAPPEAQQCFTSIWAPLEELSARLRTLPAGLVRFWLQQACGHIVVTHLSSRYEAGEQRLKHDVLHNVAYVGISDLAQGSLEALVPIGHLLDHLLGNGGTAAGLWLSAGGGVSPALQDMGRRVLQLFSLGYGFDMQARREAQTYFARSLALYLHDRHALNIADPLMEKLLRNTVFAEAFWRSREPRIEIPG